MIFEALLICAEQGLALREHRDHGIPVFNDDDYDMKKFHQDNFMAFTKIFAKFDTIIKNHIEQGSCDAKMLSWNIRNDAISYLREFVEDCTKEHISESAYYTIISDEMVRRCSNEKVFRYI